MSKKIKCPICNSKDYHTTYFEEEGGYCDNCKIWVVPESSAWEIYEIHGLDDLAIQLHHNGNPTRTWAEFLKSVSQEEESWK